MKIKSTFIALALSFVCAALVFAQNTNSSTTNSNSNANTNTNTANTNRRPRGPIFRASKDQIKQAQTILQQRNFYSGEIDGKLNPDTRAGLKKYQAAEGIKVTGTLNKVTLEKMNITLTDKQKTM